jgi:hypothetical protein
MEQAVAQPSPAPDAAPAAPSTIDQVYQSAGIEDTARSFQPQQQPQPQQRQAPQMPDIPDPLDSDAFKRYQATQHLQTASALEATQGLLNEVTRMKQEAFQAKTESDIKQSVAALKDALPGMKDNFLRVALEERAQSDPKVLSLWKARDKNPAAWQSALKVLAGEFSREYAVKQDPQIAENVRAAQLSRSGMATTQARGADDSWKGLSQNDFARKWQQLKNA